MTPLIPGAADVDFPFPPLRLHLYDEIWPLAAPFTLSRGSKTAAHVLIARVEASGCVGVGEAVPYARYGESIESAKAALSAIIPGLENGRSHDAITRLMPAGAARNALDCALWDLRAALTGLSPADVLGLPPFAPVPTAITISLGQPEAMAREADRLKAMPLLKLKLGEAAQDADRLEAVRVAAPDARLLIDANEGWTMDDLIRLAPLAARLGVELIEQPLPAASDQALAGYRSPAPLCADESCHGDRPLAGLMDRYQAVNIKLDKAGGLTAASHLMREAQTLGLSVMLGSMVATSLSMAAAATLAPLARWVDLDSPLLLAKDRDPGVLISNGWIREIP